QPRRQRPVVRTVVLAHDVDVAAAPVAPVAVAPAVAAVVAAPVVSPHLAPDLALLVAHGHAAAGAHVDLANGGTPVPVRVACLGAVRQQGSADQHASHRHENHRFHVSPPWVLKTGGVFASPWGKRAASGRIWLSSADLTDSCVN